ncbi:hypothetical protein FB107DRAFT_278801 [Schizophyllum commune]
MCIRKAWCIKIRPLWSKRYTRQGTALHGAHQYDVAIKAQQEGLANEDSPTLCKGFQEVRAAQAVYFEQDDYNKYLETCQKAGDEGREIRADLKLVAKALGRIGSAYHRKRDLANAIEFLKKSRIEHRTPDILNKLCDMEKAKADLDWVGPLLLPSVLTQGCTS